MQMSSSLKVLERYGPSILSYRGVCDVAVELDGTKIVGEELPLLRVPMRAHLRGHLTGNEDFPAERGSLCVKVRSAKRGSGHELVDASW